MDSFSWTDTAQAAFSSCLPCLSRSRGIISLDDDNNNESSYNDPTSYDHSAHRIRRARPDELVGLLLDSSDDEGEAAETLSLHSNIGDAVERRRKLKMAKKKKMAKKRERGMMLFGWHLFGRPPIHLPDEEDVDNNGANERIGPRTRTISNSSTIDSDALALDPAMIASLTSPELRAQALEADREEMRRKEERREARRLRRETRKRGLLESGLAVEGQDEFEGFQGSGDAAGYGEYAYETMSPSLSVSSPGLGFREETRGAGEDEEDDADADLGGELYATRRANTLGGSDGSRSRSDSQSQSTSRSRTLVLSSNFGGNAYSQHSYIQQQPLRSPRMAPPPSDVSGTSPRREKSRRKNGSKKAMTVSSATSHSLPSPVSATFAVSTPDIVSGAEEEDERLPAASSGFGVVRSASEESGKTFPSVGFGGARSGKTRDMGAFLATRGDA